MSLWRTRRSGVSRKRWTARISFIYSIPAAPQVSRGEPIEQAKEAARLVGAGFKALKLRVGGADVEKDIQRVKEVRQAVGSSIEIRIDANEYHTPASAVGLI